MSRRSVGRGEQRTSDPGLRVWRWPILVLIALFLMVGLVVDRSQDPSGEVASSDADSVPLSSAVADASAPGSTWYSAAGTATGVQGSDTDAEPAPGTAEQTLIIANQSDAPRRGTVTAFPEGGAPVASPLELDPWTRRVVVVSDLVKAPHAAAVVEVDGGGVTVQHGLVGPSGRSVSLCATSGSDQWVFPVGTTRPGAELTLTLFNPFAGEAVVDITALSGDGTREPEAYQGLVVPAQGLVTLQLADVITLRAQVTTVVHARSGRVIGELVQTSDGTIVADDEGSADPAYLPTIAAGLTATLGVPGPALAWVYPNGATTVDEAEQIVVYNPSETVAEVEVQVVLDDPVANGVVEPFQVTLESRSYRSVPIYDPADTRVPAGVGHSVVVRSTNNVPVVSSRAIWSTAAEDPIGLAFTVGSPVVATRWLSATASLEGQQAASITIFNPSPDTVATVSLRVSGSGRDDEVNDPGSFTIEPNGRVVVTIPPDSWGVEAAAIMVESDLPVVAENHYQLGDEGNNLSFYVLAPVQTATMPAPATTGILSTDALLGN